MTLRPHDLLRVTDTVALRGTVPAWVETALARTPWVVVRRSPAPEGFVATGVRGEDRSHRHALTIADGMIGDVVAPEDLAAAPYDDRDIPALRALAAVRGYLDACALPWGPTGSVGFELATGAPTATCDSDLDLIVRASVLTSPLLQRLTALHVRLYDAPARVDCQVETVNGAIALAELVSATSPVLVKTHAGPDLVPLAELLA